MSARHRRLAPAPSRRVRTAGRGPLEAGFSLVEMMVVIFVMGLLASVAVLSMPGDDRALRREAERFAARTAAARDEAITAGRPVAVVISEAGYYFEQRIAGRWEPLGTGAAGLTGWAAGTAAVLTGQAPAAQVPTAQASPGAQAAGRARVVFDPVGLASSEAAVRLVRGGHSVGVRIARDGQVRLDGGN